MSDERKGYHQAMLDALPAEDIFEVLDRRRILGAEPTPFAKVVEETFNHPGYSCVTPEF